MIDYFSPEFFILDAAYVCSLKVSIEVAVGSGSASSADVFVSTVSASNGATVDAIGFEFFSRSELPEKFAVVPDVFEVIFHDVPEYCVFVGREEDTWL